MIEKVLIANRGEIAVRIMRSCREMGIKTVAVFSEADRRALHVRYADEAYFIGPAPSNESYLVVDKIMDVAKQTGADAIHPGYGFLSENPGFAKRVEKEGLIFIGPTADAISTMGDKVTARKTMIKAGVPVVPGTEATLESDEQAKKTVKEVGLPVMIKASAGGGGKGMRMVKTEENIIPALRAARSEAKEAFGDDAIYVEKYVTSPHHIEFQVLADTHGNVIHLYERECSVQRRHQKVVEETPSPLLRDDVRQKMGKDAVEAARAVNYRGAGTVEFIVDEDQNYYFLEMNTRLQVEHPITERVVGVDLVKEQINIANGKPLTYRQEDLKQFGHAIECRIYAEDPNNNFMPSPGLIKHITEPMGLGVRTDGYVHEGYEIPLYYDPMISKLIIWGSDRKDAIGRMRRALHEYKITGVRTTIKFLEKIMQCDDFIKGTYNTHFIENNYEFLTSNEDCDETCEDLAVITAFFDYISKVDHMKSDRNVTKLNAWKEFGRRKGVMRL
ncbi:MAG: acetyl-CoA carboxylase biotin carboxylase subunit [Bacteroidales bacterium]|nr:acetyl-CoA carboxylase biotin carboxylase subunit [Bacteroidales bacterium]